MMLYIYTNNNKCNIKRVIILFFIQPGKDFTKGVRLEMILKFAEFTIIEYKIENNIAF